MPEPVSWAVPVMAERARSNSAAGRMKPADGSLPSIIKILSEKGSISITGGASSLAPLASTLMRLVPAGQLPTVLLVQTRLSAPKKPQVDWPIT